MASQNSHSQKPMRLPSRREALQLSAGLGLLAIPHACLAETNEAKPNKRRGQLIRPLDLDALDVRCKMVLELDGKLRMHAPDGDADKDIREADVRAKSTLEYYERVAFLKNAPAVAAREYSTAESENWLAGKTNQQSLRSKCSSVQAMAHPVRWEQYCSNEPLNAREVELLTTPINTAFLDYLLPTKAAKPNEPWSVSKDDAQHLFNVEAVHESSLQAKITQVEKGIATVALEGKLNATANSVSTKLVISGTFRVKLAEHGAMVNWLSLSLQEDREISNAEPGFKIAARLRLIREPSDFPKNELSGEDLRKQLAVESPGRWLITQKGQRSGCSLLTDRNWKVYIDGGEELILRMIENNMVIAQCNISRLPDRTPGSELTIEKFEDDIRRTLGEAMNEILESRQSRTDRKLSHLRVVAAGMMEEVPVQWIYNHLQAEDGRRVAMVFTLGGNVTDRFGAADEQMTLSFDLGNQKFPAQTAKSASANTTR